MSKRKLSEITDEADTVKKTKVQESSATPKVEINPKLKDVELLKGLKSKWGKGFFGKPVVLITIDLRWLVIKVICKFVSVSFEKNRNNYTLETISFSLQKRRTNV